VDRRNWPERGDADSTRCDLQAALATLEVDLKFIHVHSGKCKGNYYIVYMHTTLLQY
jgi:hypothetical protein